MQTLQKVKFSHTVYRALDPKLISGTGTGSQPTGDFLSRFRADGRVWGKEKERVRRGSEGSPVGECILPVMVSPSINTGWDGHTLGNELLLQMPEVTTNCEITTVMVYRVAQKK